MITNEALFVLKNNLTFTKRVNRQFDASYGVDGAKIGTVLNIRKPPRFTATEGPGLSIQDISETSVPLALTTQAQVAFTFTTSDRLLSIDDFSDRLLQPALAAIANKVDFDGLQQYVNVANTVGTVGSPPNTALIYLTAGAVLSNNCAPKDGRRSSIVNPINEAYIVDALKGLFQSATQIREQYEMGQMGIALGFEWFMDQNCGVQIIGALGGTPAVNGSGQSGAVLNINGMTANVVNAFNAGDVIQLGTGATGVFQVNPQSRLSSGRLQDFTVLSNATTNGSGQVSVNIFPAIVASGSGQTVSQSPASGTLITVFGVAAAGQAAIANTPSPVGMCFHRDAFSLATADLPLPTGGVVAAYRVSDKALGISVRIIQAYSVETDKMPVRVEVLYGWVTMRGETACRVQS